MSIYVYTYIYIRLERLNGGLVYRFIIVIVKLFFVGHVWGCWVMTLFQFILNFGRSLPWFFIFFIIYYIDVIIPKHYPGWLPSKTSRPSTRYLSFIQESPLDLISMGLSRYCWWF